MHIFGIPVNQPDIITILALIVILSLVLASEDIKNDTRHL